MDYLYSRPRIKCIKFNHRSNKKPVNKKKIIAICIIIAICSSLVIAIKAVSPLFNKLCSEKAISKATIITNQITSKVMKKYTYFDFITIHRDENQDIKMIQSNMVNINNFISDVTEQIQKEIDNVPEEDIAIRMGSFTGISLLSGRGPKVPIRIFTVGNIKTNVKSEFTNAGINQTLHRLYLEIECEISILTPFNTINEKIFNQLIIAENIIVGNIPNSYYNIEGITPNEALELVE